MSSEEKTKNRLQACRSFLPAALCLLVCAAVFLLGWNSYTKPAKEDKSAATQQKVLKVSTFHGQSVSPALLSSAVTLLPASVPTVPNVSVQHSVTAPAQIQSYPIPTARIVAPAPTVYIPPIPKITVYQPVIPAVPVMPSVPQISIPSMPQINIPSINIPSMPQINIPHFNYPSLP